jgi:hypothetical protein
VCSSDLYSVHFESVKSVSGRKRKGKEMVTEIKRRKQTRQRVGKVRKKKGR